ncbi:peptidoglycan-binding domain-containing protein [Streptomyces spiramenti]|uniref:Peptidoglycan binding-like domain-containing protein n=1 Tax=Streptomyces spiramenti TaxID=2720606 RepID=A0ABX1AP25_9ACTN|nr:peptidoglycan-binding domain-containing protein [Streptomyces spiramenti]NJP67153.1 hypothetical protein [Streptomyces spiramenti]
MNPGTSCATCGHPAGATGDRNCHCPPGARESARDSAHGQGAQGAEPDGANEEYAPIRPLLPPHQGPDPGDLAMFSDTARLPLVREDDPRPVQHSAPQQERSAPPAPPAVSAPPVSVPTVSSPNQDVTPPEATEHGGGRRGHRKPRHHRASFLAGTAVALVVGCTAVVTSVLGGRTADNTAYHDVDPVPDSEPAPDGPPPEPRDEKDEPETATETEALPAPPDGAEHDAEDGASGEAPAPPPVDREAEGPAGDGSPDRSSRQDGGSHSAAPPPPSGTNAPPPPEESSPEDVVRGPNALLGPGDEGAAVRALQEQLNAVGDHFTVPVTGVYDQATFESVARFQEWYGVWQREVRGVYCGVTDERMEAFFAE